jgi:hypothetical protein
MVLLLPAGPGSGRVARQPERDADRELKFFAGERRHPRRAEWAWNKS